MNKELSEVTTKYGALDILTDARHGWRKNARQSDIVCISAHSNKVIKYEVVTSQDDPVAQRHERLGTERIYQSLQGHHIKRHCHDNNASITKYIRENHPNVVNQLDNWHGLKSLEKHLTTISKGTKRLHGSTWHKELDDKVKSIRTHAMFALKNCDGDPTKLREILLIPLLHYQNIHHQCIPTARCRRQNNYEPSKMVLGSPKAVELLENAIKTSNIYNKAELYCENMTLNIFQHKRISFGNNTYKLRSTLAVIHWNENVGRGAYARQSDEGDSTKKLSLIPQTHNYHQTLWFTYINARLASYGSTSASSVN